MTRQGVWGFGRTRPFKSERRFTILLGRTPKLRSAVSVEMYGASSVPRSSRSWKTPRWPFFGMATLHVPCLLPECFEVLSVPNYARFYATSPNNFRRGTGKEKIFEGYGEGNSVNRGLARFVICR